MKKLVSFILASLLTVLMLLSCGKDEFRTDIAVSDISSAFNSLVENSSYLSEIPEEYINSTMKIPTDKCDEFAVCIPTSGSTFDEFGIFKVKDVSSIEEIKNSIKDYISRRTSDSLALKYIPNDAPNVTGAEIKIDGLYITYAMLSDSEKSSVFEKLDEMLS